MQMSDKHHGFLPSPPLPYLVHLGDDPRFSEGSVRLAWRFVQRIISTWQCLSLFSWALPVDWRPQVSDIVTPQHLLLLQIRVDFPALGCFTTDPAL